MNTIYNKIGILAAASALLLSAGCMQLELNDPAMDENIVFGASTEYENDAVETRTEYSGQILGSTTKYERINWIPGQDKVRVVCNEANGVSSHWLDYNIGSVSAQSEKSTATVTSASGESFKWDGANAHYFYALYPSPAQNGAPSGASIAAATGHKATVQGSIPAIQTGEWVASTRTFKPNMNYAYMYAAKQQSNTNPPATANVTLEFKPLVTAMEFSIVADNVFPITSPLTKAELTASTSLAGGFTANLDATKESGLADEPGISDGSTSLTINFPSGITLSKTDATTFTFLALPVEQKDLTLRLTFSNGSTTTTRSLLLKTGNVNISVAARKKLYIKSLGVMPDVNYEFEVTGPTETFSSIAQDVPYSVTSYATDGSNFPAVGWTAKYYDKNGTLISRPSWLDQFTDSGPGSKNPTNYNGHVTANPATKTKSWGGPKTVSGNTTDTRAIDLSLQDIYGNAHSCTTANSYVVSKPGWYKFPCVYGNGISNGSTNSGAYQVSGIVNHQGSSITNPWIQNVIDYGSSSSGLYNYHWKFKVTLAWQDVDGLIQTGNNLKVQAENSAYGTGGQTIYFYVDPNKIAQGNAMLCLVFEHWETGKVSGRERKRGEEVVWSWHIWVTEDQSVNDHLKTTPVYGHATNNRSITNPNKMMNVNLGWYDANKVSEPRSVRVVFTQNTSGKTKEFTVFQRSSNGFGGNVYYQWGRKDPMSGFDENLNAKTTYGPWPVTLKNESPATNESILHPNFFYYAVWDWSNNMSDKFWNANGTYGEDKVVKKTVYDPCPPGFKVPNMNAFSGFSTTGNWYYTGNSANVVGYWQDGIHFKRSANDNEGIFFARTTLREWNSGEVRTGYEFGCVWTAARALYHQNESLPDSEGKRSGVYLEYTKHGMTAKVAPMWKAGPPTFGFSVRPVEE